LKYKKTIMLAMLLISLLSISAVSASENVTANTIGTDDASNDINLEDEDYDDYDEDSDWNDEYYSDNFQPRIIPEDYSYRQNIPEQINYSTDYDDYYGYYISVVDEDGYNIPDLEVRLMDANTNKELMAFDYDEDEDAYWCCVSNMGVGNHSCKIIVDDYYYNINPIYFNLEIVKSDVELILKETTVVKGDYAILKAKITDFEGSTLFEDGKVKFTIHEGTQPGDEFKLRGKGIKRLNYSGNGDQYVKIIVEIPKDLNKEQREKLSAFDQSLNDKNYKKRKSFIEKVKDLFD